MADQSMNFLPSTVTVASFVQASTVKIAIAGASWWTYAGILDGNSSLTMSITGAPLGLNCFGLTPQCLIFTFSTFRDALSSKNSDNYFDGETGRAAFEQKPVIPPTVTVHLYIQRADADFVVSMENQSPAMAGIVFCDQMYPLDDKKIPINWPT
ncbi:hypothetical protein [Trinickia sp.]|uniref:hypothetical protein n=1 Tax=Trinickia sp. TaxID=2571163 RepID=UPI003F80CDA7